MVVFSFPPLDPGCKGIPNGPTSTLEPDNKVLAVLIVNDGSFSPVIFLNTTLDVPTSSLFNPEDH